jgi:hypothetical protein
MKIPIVVLVLIAAVSLFPQEPEVVIPVDEGDRALVSERDIEWAMRGKKELVPFAFYGRVVDYRDLGTIPHVDEKRPPSERVKESDTIVDNTS